MPKTVNTSISEQLHQVLKANEEGLKGEYLTLRLFIDAAIRSALRKRGIDPGDDEIIAHLAKLKESKARHINQQVLLHRKQAHKRRVARERRKLEQKIGE